MTELRVVLEGEGCWPDLSRENCVRVELEGVARLHHGTEQGKSSVSFRLRLPDGRFAIAETTMRLFLVAAAAFIGAEEREAGRAAP
jgi:hypothetical protein